MSHVQTNKGISIKRTLVRMFRIVTMTLIDGRNTHQVNRKDEVGRRWGAYSVDGGIEGPAS